MEPDFQGFARSWVDNDGRVSEFVRAHPEVGENLVARMAEALEQRRRQVQAQQTPSPTDGGGNLIVTIDPSRFEGPRGLDDGAWEQLASLVEEHYQLGESSP